MDLIEERVQLLAHVIIKQDNEIRALKEKVRNMQNEAVKCDIVISGIKESDKEDVRKAVQVFLTTKLKMQTPPECKDAYRIGKGDKRPIIVKLTSFKEKLQIYKHQKNLKDAQSEEGTKYYINDNLLGKEAAEV